MKLKLVRMDNLILNLEIELDIVSFLYLDRGDLDISQITSITQIFPHTRRHPQYNYTATKAYYTQSVGHALGS